MARAVTSVGDMITALASAGTWYLSSSQKVILTRRLRFDLVDLADRHPRMRTSSPAKMPLLFSK